jgi:hypothetical protein
MSPEASTFTKENTALKTFITLLSVSNTSSSSSSSSYKALQPV